MAQDFRDKLLRFSPRTEMPVAHYSINGWWGARANIRQQEMVHWFLGLRQAENEIYGIEGDLAYNRQAVMIHDRTIRRKQRRLRFLKSIKWLAVLNSSIQDEIEDIEMDIADSEQERHRLEPLVRDALMELDVVVAERDRILAEHQQEVEGKTFEQLQAEYTPAAALEGTARMIAAEVWAQQQGLPGMVGMSLSQLAVEERQYVLQREAELRLGIETTQAIAHANQVLSILPPERRSAVLMVAAQMVAQQEVALPPISDP